MKPATPPLSREQKLAQEHYLSAIVPAMLVAMLCSVTLVTSINVLLRQLNWSGGSSGSFGSMFCVCGGFLLAHLWALRKVRNAGLSLESQHIESIELVKPDYQGDAVNWRYPKTLLGATSYVFFLVVISIGSWWLWRHHSVSGFQRIIGFVGFWMFLWASCVSLFFFRSPRISIDNEGITAFVSEFWRRRVAWKDVTLCEIRHFYNYMGQGPTRFIYFKSASGKILLQMNPASLGNFSGDEQAEIEREIKRRIGHTKENEPESTPI